MDFFDKLVIPPSQNHVLLIKYMLTISFLLFIPYIGMVIGSTFLATYFNSKAKKTGNPILPFSVEAEKFWTINSWDKLQIPKPFSRARFFYAEPIYVVKEANDEELEKKLGELQAKLDELVELGKQWRKSIK